MPTITNYFRGRSVFVKGQRRWSETIRFATTAPLVAAAAFRDWLNYRVYLLGLGCNVDYAAMHDSDSERDSYLPGNPVVTLVTVPEEYLAYPQLIGAEVAVEAVNDVASGYLFTFFTDSGKWSNYLIRGIRDGWTAGQNATISNDGSIAVLASGVAPGAAPTAINALKNFLSVHMSRTAHIFKNPGGDYTFEPYTAFQYQRISSRKVGTGYPQVQARRKATV